ncbi:YciI family protein [Microbacterium sp. 179-I 3D4 NHS]|uniref:YciI family protein n=1 Tax=Microbacterium sp. 179-I 3D4 NHS TaxID=3142381 RepID=UPI0039A1CDC6
MTTYLISFPSAAMQVSNDELPDVSAASRAVVREAKDAGVWVFGGAIDESIAPVRVSGDGEIEDSGYPQTAEIAGGYALLRLPTYDDALTWAAKFAAACRCAQEVRAFRFDPES